VLAATIAASIAIASQSTANATPGIVASDESPTSSAVNATDTVGPFGGGPCMMFGGQRGGMDRGFGGFGGPGDRMGFGSVQVSSDFTANVTTIAKADSDVQNLLNQGYNITSIRPVISTVIDGNGNVVTKASTADLTLQGTNGRALVVVDLDQAKVTKIVTLTVTEIDK
jgi:hypothetical protein